MFTAPDTIPTPRFDLRPLVRSDAAALFSTMSDEAQCRYLSRGAFSSEQELADWLTDADWPGRSWVAIDRADRTVVGRFVAVDGRDAGVIEVAYITVRSRQGEGIALECMRALIAHLFEHSECRRIFAEIDIENTASIALARRLGLSFEGCLREHDRTHKGVCDLAVYGMLRREFAG